MKESASSDSTTAIAELIKSGFLFFFIAARLIVAYEGLTPAFSGAVSGIERNHENRASRPPLQRLVRLSPSEPRSFTLTNLRYSATPCPHLSLEGYLSLGLSLFQQSSQGCRT